MPLLVATAFLGCARSDPPPVLLFNGTGTSPNDVRAFERLLRQRHLRYATVSSAQLNRLSAAELNRHRLLIVPGGNFVTMGETLTIDATRTVHRAVRDGLGYLGVCAGAFLASDSGYNSFNLTSGVRFRFYAAESRGIRKAAVPIAVSGLPTLEHYWEDGPQLTGWGTVVGRYPDGTPAIVQHDVGRGRVVLCGVHPEAPGNWRDGLTFTTPPSETTAFAASLVDAALNRTDLPHF